MIARLPIARQSVLLGRMARALRHWVRGRLSDSSFDAISDRIRREIEASNA